MRFISVLMGSKSDYEIMKEAVKVLEKFQIPYELIITSAHRTPERTHDYVKNAEKRGAQVFICGAGMAAHLAGVVASLTTRPVIGVPMPSGMMDGLDALLSTVQMPGGMPVATLAVGKAGAKNAAYLALQILANSDDELKAKLEEDRIAQAKKVELDSKEVEVRLD
ncbi:5-(carboxyamino)imidazole ribonucleotide mutase [Caminibacter mediatlanticus TB-2]|uniref:N5-carboxyaminoimidazole ribonucleotide mutase n=1 Tax=Caminibacter mediatlanticus TB-2 TaxID=391592 RepID=A0AAI9AG18_9BACT|nr:5-(carboxyamino)imidazole ribonucleotide mutase [Caminibacter mediatlanticus]EDM23003.1 phosphoribosylaminoimidazole carboxylase catalytic subunit [Caminibacter mediatlanticus TB-2]QCT94125.1 5-(carboxyamino)imidazole ribonucleotide mutase [Caminibacter mediatlanticus TB-2]